MKNKVCIELHTDNNYVVPTVVTVTSLFANKHPDCVYDVRILGNNLTPENIQLLEKTLAGRGKVIAHVSSLAKFEGTHPHVSSTDLFKFDLPDVLSDWDKVLYLDTDMIIQGDLSELFNTELGDNYIAAVKDMAGMVLEKHHKRNNLTNYFNAGMMLMNLKKMRAESIGDKLTDFKLHKDIGHFMSQDALNSVFGEKVVWLHPKYNYMAPNQVAFNSKEIAQFYGVPEKDVVKLDKQAIIVHLTNRQKPWDYLNVYGSKLWAAYYKKSVLKDIKRQYKDVPNPKLFGWSGVGPRRYFYMFYVPLFYKERTEQYKQISVWGITIKYKELH